MEHPKNEPVSSIDASIAGKFEVGCTCNTPPKTAQRPFAKVLLDVAQVSQYQRGLGVPLDSYLELVTPPPPPKQEHVRVLAILRVLMICVFLFVPHITVSPLQLDSGWFLA